jgi:hypothetical protein
LTPVMARLRPPRVCAHHGLGQLGLRLCA